MDPRNETLDRLFRHMAWANQSLMERLQTLPSGSLMLTADHDEWTAGAILMHLVRSAGFYVSRVTGEPLQTDFTVPMNKKDVGKIAARSAIFDARLRELASEPEGMTSFVREGKTIHRARSTILAQSIHHATEHRAQIADVLALHGITVVNLDEMDVWAYSDFEGLGQ